MLYLADMLQRVMTSLNQRLGGVRQKDGRHLTDVFHNLFFLQNFVFISNPTELFKINVNLFEN